MKSVCVYLQGWGYLENWNFVVNSRCEVPEESIFTWSDNLINDLSQHIDIPIIRKAGIFGKSYIRRNTTEI